MAEEDDIFAALEADFKDVDVSDTILVSELETAELLNIYNGASIDLFESKQVLAPKTQEARDNHSLYYSAKMELIRRGIL